MKRTRIGLCEAEIYDSIDEMPITRWHKYNKYALLDSGIGGDLSALDGHLQKAVAFIRKGEPDKATIELENLRQSVFLIQNETSPQLLSAACLIKSLDGEECNDLTEEGLRRVIEKLADVPTNLFAAIIVAVKKKMETEMDAYFPTLSTDGKEKEYHDLLRKRTIAVLEGINGKDTRKEVRDLTDDLLTSTKPRTFNEKSNYEVDFDKAFERMCVTISQNLNIEPKKCSVLEFYTAYEAVKQQFSKPNKRTR